MISEILDWVNDNVFEFGQGIFRLIAVAVPAIVGFLGIHFIFRKKI